MIDCENEVYTRVKNSVCSEIQGVSFTGDYVIAPPSFPHVSVMQMDSTAAVLDSSGNEITAVMFEINIYSNKSGSKKSECKSILKVIDRTLNAMNFRRIALTPVPNLEDASIYRLTARYRAATDGKNFYRR